MPCGPILSRMATFMELRNSITSYTPTEGIPRQAWLEQTSLFISSAHLVLRAGLGWVFELGIDADMPFFQQKNLALINRVTFLSLLMALPGTFLLILMGFGHPFSLLVSGVLAACLVLAFNGAKHTEWSKTLFAFAPATLILIFTLLELSAGNMDNPLRYILSRQGICFGLLIPLLIFGFEDRRKVVGVLGFCILLFLIFDVGTMRLGAFKGGNIIGLSSGLFSILSGLQYAGLAACVLYMQSYTMRHELQAQSSNEKLYRLAIRDGMTGIFNHTFMEQYISDAINRSKRSQNPLSVLMIDVDFFKQINDTLGHNAGDDVLIDLVKVLDTNKRATDYLGRWGGDELVLLLTDTNLAGAAYLAEKLRHLVEGHSFLHNKHLTISLGASVYRDSDSLASLIERADAAMYRAKRGGRNKVELQRATGINPV